jgi:Tol biopolymer transport system component
VYRRSNHHWKTLGALGLTLILSTAFVGASADETGTRLVRIETDEQGRGERLAPGAPQGIRSYGAGAIRAEIPEAAVLGERPRSIFEGRGTGASVKISGVTMAGSVAAFTLSPDGSTAVYIADQDTVGLFELYSAPVDGSAAPTKLNQGLPFGAGDEGVSAFRITPDSAQVVFTADPDNGGSGDDIFSVPIDGSSAPVQLNAGAERPVTGFAVTADSVYAAFVGVDTNFGSGATELYAAPIGTAASATQISDVGSTNSQGNVVAAAFSPDSARAIYAADAVADEVFQWFSVPVNATGPGSDVQLSTAIGSVSLGAVSPDSGTVVYTGDETTSGVMDVIAVPIGGGTGIRLNPAMAGSGAAFIAISPDSAMVSYLADQETDGVVEVFSAQIGVADSGTRLNTPLVSGQSADTLTISPDSTTVLYEADENTMNTFDLLAAPIDASAQPSTLHGFTPPDNAAYFSDLGTPVIGQRAVYPALSTTVDLFSVPFDGSGPFTRINDPLAAGETLFSAFLPTQATRLLAYGIGPDTGSVTDRAYAAPIRPGLPIEQFNVTAGAGAQGVLAYEISSDEVYAVYLQDQDTDGKPELFSRELDSDADTVANSGDNCIFVANALQDAVVFGQDVMAASRSTFVWDNTTEVRYARGPLSMVGVYATDDSGTLVDSTSLVDPTEPGAGEGLYYVFAPDCPGRSYQTTPGAEPGRDAAALP